MRLLIVRKADLLHPESAEFNKPILSILRRVTFRIRINNLIFGIF